MLLVQSAISRESGKEKTWPATTTEMRRPHVPWLILGIPLAILVLGFTFIGAPAIDMEIPLRSQVWAVVLALVCTVGFGRVDYLARRGKADVEATPEQQIRRAQVGGGVAVVLAAAAIIAALQDGPVPFTVVAVCAPAALGLGLGAVLLFSRNR